MMRHGRQPFRLWGATWHRSDATACPQARRCPRPPLEIGPATPFVLTRYEDGRLVLDDPATKASVTISSFGPTQIAAFDTLLFAGRVAAPASAGTAAVSDSGRSSR